ncbi:UvrD-helicase domain-containing protein [Rhizobium sp. P44RR-XXIV]|uniref:UvrD-helicase domain-containing protein n=1 Tax=Rhizobium sp. P44RR-XXIV TaxID=1921145 RepID=UPI000987669C|nr:UvrD-helicase domain-containing protein [Rhizobium sp. P44RR-XXIV]TIX91605.1 ATP-dependent helicase [Rhizobium sp. P44RR-XXIV]
MTEVITDVDRMDEHVDDEIAACLNLKDPKSFFLFAGAGSGKTRSLVKALEHIRKNFGEELRLHNRRVAVVTYTKKARDEIISRLQFDPLFSVMTIHAFAWSIIQGFNHDIREWLRSNLKDEIAKLQADESKGRKGTKASAERLADIESKTRRLSQLDEVSTFVYNPDGENRGKGSLAHAEVVKMTGAFVRDKAILQKVLRDGFPFILIDESQDTNKHIVDAMFALQAAHKQAMAIGLFGDMMQRIYADGVADLGSNLPSDWAKPVKKLNFRCPRRVVTLLNKIREATDKQKQVACSNAQEGFVRVFLLDANTPDKPAAEKKIADLMAHTVEDRLWSDPENIKSLILEHKMAARRLGFFALYEPLYGFEPFKTGLRDGNLPILNFFASHVASLVDVKDDKFAVMRIVSRLSPLMSPDFLRSVEDEKKHLQKVQKAVDSLFGLFASGASPTFLDVLKIIDETRLFSVPDILRPALASAGISDPTAGSDDDRSERDIAISAFLNAEFKEIWPYQKYAAGLAQFDTHQGVKGLEFPRVMVIMDDAEAAGFAFKYDKLFAAGAAEDGITAATRRLFYVTCSRAERSLCLIAYSKTPLAVRDTLINRGWFEDKEVIVVESNAM